MPLNWWKLSLENILTQQKSEVVDANVITSRLRYYVRQYFGYIDKDGNKIIFINCFSQTCNIYQRERYWLKDEVSAWDGGAAFWNVKINLASQKLFEFYVNGY
jgi:hypothetical protein